LGDDAYGILVVLLEPNGIVENAAQTCPALVDARRGEALLSQICEEVPHRVRCDLASLFFPNRTIMRGVLYSNLLRVLLPWWPHQSMKRSMNFTLSKLSATNRFFMATSVRAWGKHKFRSPGIRLMSIFPHDLAVLVLVADVERAVLPGVHTPR
jgi:hypothetical protein